MQRKTLRPDQYPFPSGIVASPHISTRQYARMFLRWVIYRRTRKIRAVQLLLGHTQLESTVRYLGIEVDDALEIAKQTET